MTNIDVHYVRYDLDLQRYYMYDKNERKIGSMSKIEYNQFKEIYPELCISIGSTKQIFNL